MRFAQFINGSVDSCASRAFGLRPSALHYRAEWNSRSCQVFSSNNDCRMCDMQTFRNPTGSLKCLQRFGRRNHVSILDMWSEQSNPPEKSKMIQTLKLADQ